jgi:hypothetical protein
MVREEVEVHNWRVKLRAMARAWVNCMDGSLPVESPAQLARPSVQQRSMTTGMRLWILPTRPSESLLRPYYLRTPNR